MIKYVPFKKEHLDLIDLREHESVLFQNPHFAECLEGSLAYTACYNGRVMCAYGIIPYVKGIGEIWLLPSVYLGKEAIKLGRRAKLWLEDTRQDLGLHRMETLCLNDELHTRWMEFLGFECEGVKRKYWDGKDYKMWGRIWE